MNTSYFRETTQWDQVLRLVLSALISLGIAYGIGLTGGLITVIAVLFMPVLPHSPSLAILRFATGIAGFGLGWILAYQFVDQPWLLILVLATNSFFWFYMLATGLPFLSMTVMGLLPFLVGWMVYAGKPPSAVATSLAQYLCGVVGSELVAMFWPNSGVMRVKAASAATLRLFAKHIRTGLGSDRAGQTEMGKTNWEPSKSLGFNNLLLRVRMEMGESSRDFRRLAGLIENIRHLAAWPKMYRMFVHGGHFDQWMVDLMEERNALHEAIYKSMDEVAVALETGKPAADQLELAAAMNTVYRRTDEWFKENREHISLETIATIHARCHYGEVIEYRLQEIIKYTRNEEAEEEQYPSDLPKTSLTDIAYGFNPKLGLFAFKSVVCVLIGFTIASLFPDWGGSLVLLLLSGFLAPLSVGGLSVMLIDRIWGLVMAVLVALIGITIVMPNIVQVGELLVFVGIVLLPGLVLALKPKTASMGLSYSMALLFILTSANMPSVSLVPIQERFVAVGGATLNCYLVFRILLPTTARDLVSFRLKAAFESIADLLVHSSLTDHLAQSQRVELRAKRHVAVHSCGEFDQLVEDFQWESDAPDRVVQFRHESVDLLNANLLLAGTTSVLSTERSLRGNRELSAIMNETISGLSKVEALLSNLAVFHGEYKELSRSSKRVDDLLACEREHLLRSGIVDRMALDDPSFDETRFVLTEYAHHRALRKFQHRIYRVLVARDLLAERVRPEVFGRTV
jgi:hypothetical protein